MTDMMELEERAKAAPGWTWKMAGIVGGFKDYDGERAPFVVVEIPTRGFGVSSPMFNSVHRVGFFLAKHPDARPDLTSPATIGCLLALVREAWGDPLAVTMVDLTGIGSPHWTVSFQERVAFVKSSGWQFSEVDALVYALENAP